MTALDASAAKQVTETIQTANQLIAVWQFIAANASLFRDGIYCYGYEFAAGFYGENAKEELVQAMNTIRRHYNAKADKNYNGENFTAHINVPNSLVFFRLYTARGNVCTRVDTGEVEVKEVPDYDKAPKKTVTKPIYEWVCDPILSE